MRLNHSLLLTIPAAALFLSACSKVDDTAASSGDAAAESAAGNADPAGPAIAGIVAPGVAFAYRYAFSLPGDAIAKVQQQHAAACEKLGTARCRVTGMSYEQPREGEIAAEIDFLLAPDIAHSFGSAGIEAVTGAKGKLDNASISGEDAGGAIKLSQHSSAGIEAEVKRIEERLALGGLSKGERIELQQQLSSLREQLRGEVATRRQKEASIATTPVSFAYASEGLIGGGNAFGKAASASWGSAQTALSFVLLLAGVALPWLLLAGLVLLLFRSPDLRRLIKRLFGLGAHEPARIE